MEEQQTDTHRENPKEDSNFDINNTFEIRNNRITKLIDLRNSKDNTKNLYENVGQKVLKIRDTNDFYEQKIVQTENEIKLLKERIKAKKTLLETTMQGHQKPKSQIKLHDSQWMSNFYMDQLSKNELKMTINQHHIDNDPQLLKKEKKKGVELSTLKNSHNSYIKKIDEIQNDIDVLRKENNKLRSNLSSIVNNKEKQNKEMSKISEEANQYLHRKSTFNEELVKINRKIDTERAEHEAKMKELSKMIDNTKKKKQFNETLAIEKFSNKTTRRNEGEDTGTQSIHKIIEEQHKLNALEEELVKAKKITVHLNFQRLILLKKQSQTNAIIAKVKRETGIDNLDKLNSDLELIKHSNLKFDKELKELYNQKEDLSKNIERKKEQIKVAEDLLNDNHTKVEEHIYQLETDLEETRSNKDQLDKRFFALSKLISLISKIFKSFYDKVNVNDKGIEMETQRNEEIIVNCMELFEKNMIDIIQMNRDPSKDASSLEQDESKNTDLIKKISDSINHVEHDKLFDKKKCIQPNFNLKEIKEISKEMASNYIKKYDSHK